MATLFREIQGRPITRDVVEAVAQQQDFMRRIRSDNGRGTRDLLARDSIALLSGHYDSPLIRALGLPECSASEFISVELKDQEMVDIAAAHGVVIG